MAVERQAECRVAESRVERDSLRVERNGLLTERDMLQLECETWRGQCDELRVQLTSAETQQTQRMLLELELARLARENAAAEEREKQWLKEREQMQQSIEESNQHCRSLKLEIDEAVRMTAISANMDKIIKAQLSDLSAEMAVLKRKNYELEAQLAAALRSDESNLEAARLENKEKREAGEAREVRGEKTAERFRQAFFEFGKDLGSVLENVGILK